MFERYTEQARRVVFFARYEAAQLASASIDTEHLLLGILREGAGLAGQILRRAGVTSSAALKEVKTRVTPEHPVPTSVDIPLATAAMRVLEHANEEAERTKAEHIGVEHLLLGLILEPSTIAGEILRASGVTIDEVREEVRLAARGTTPMARPTPVFQRLIEFLGQLHRRRAVYHVSSFHGTAARVEVVLPDERWAVTFFTDGRVTVETFSLSGAVQDEGSLTRLLARLGSEDDRKE